MTASQTYTYTVARSRFRYRLPHLLRILRVLARTDFKLKYAGSFLGYLWSVLKPLLYFIVMWIVFAKLFRSGIRHFRQQRTPFLRSSSSIACV